MADGPLSRFINQVLGPDPTPGQLRARANDFEKAARALNQIASDLNRAKTPVDDALKKSVNADPQLERTGVPFGQISSDIVNNLMPELDETIKFALDREDKLRKAAKDLRKRADEKERGP